MTFYYRARPRIAQMLRRGWAVVWRAMVKYTETDGEQRAASFAYYAFFSIFPFILFLISVGTAFMGQEIAQQKVLAFIVQYLPADPETVRSTIGGVMASRNSAGLISVAVLAWSSLRFFQALVRGVNKAWGTKEYSWWRLPLQNLLFVGIVAMVLVLGIFVPPAIDLLEYYFDDYYWQVSTTPKLDFMVARQIFQFSRFIVPPLVLFYGFSIFYRVAPQRRTRFREVWLASGLVTLGLQGLQRLVVIYTTKFTDLNRVYGALGGVVALLVWIYLSGSLIIFCACISAAQWEIGWQITDQSEKSTR